MAFIAISGEPGCRHQELARMVADRLECQLVTGSGLDQMIAGQFGESNIPDRAWGAAAASVLATQGLEYPHVVVCCPGAGMLSRDLPGVLRVHVVAPESLRLGTLIAGSKLSRPAAKARLRKLAAEQSETRKRRFGQRIAPATGFDLVLNEHAIPPAEMANALVTLVQSQRLLSSERLIASAAAKVQFQVRMQLARYGLGRHMGALPDQAPSERKAFGHPSEEVFANLLDFYRIAWDYEPRSFPLQWDKDGKVSEAFTPDFYLPEFDLYVELTTMKQANVTKKNRKIRLLRAIYPHVNIQVFYQKDVQDLVMKYRPPERLAR
jgi:Cytidylate kinase-like family